MPFLLRVLLPGVWLLAANCSSEARLDDLCRLDVDCPAGDYCASGRCLTCPPCASGQRCVAGRCEDPGNVLVGTLQEFCPIFVRDRTLRLASCRGDDPAAAAATLAASREVERLCATLLASEAAGRLQYVKEQSRACLEALGSASCLEVGRQPAPCAATLVGKTSMGGVCYDNFDCGDDGVCLGTSLAQSAPTTCAAGLCTARAGFSGACSGGQPCDRAAFCRSLAAGLETCQLLPAEGETCGSGAGTTSCADDYRLVCDGTRCIARRTLGACQTAEECLPGFTCAGSASIPSSRSCQPTRAAGESCEVGAGQCASGLACVKQVCRLRPLSGEACGPATAEAEALSCLLGTCGFAGTCEDLAPAKLGETCTTGKACLGGVCEQGVCRACPPR